MVALVALNHAPLCWRITVPWRIHAHFFISLASILMVFALIGCQETSTKDLEGLSARNSGISSRHRLGETSTLSALVFSATKNHILLVRMSLTCTIHGFECADPPGCGHRITVELSLEAGGVQCDCLDLPETTILSSFGCPGGELEEGLAA